MSEPPPEPDSTSQKSDLQLGEDPSSKDSEFKLGEGVSFVTDGPLVQSSHIIANTSNTKNASKTGSQIKTDDAPTTKSNTNTGVSVEEGGVNDKDGPWVLEKMFKMDQVRPGRKDNHRGVDNNEAAWALDNPWVLEKMFKVDKETCEPLSAMDSTSRMGGFQYKFPEDVDGSNLYEKDEGWLLEKMHGKDMGFSAMIKTSRINCQGSNLKSNMKPECINKKRACDLARTMLVAYDSLTSCDIIGKTECDSSEDFEPDMVSWIFDMVVGMLYPTPADNDTLNSNLSDVPTDSEPEKPQDPPEEDTNDCG